MITDDLRQRRLALIEEHFRTEVSQEFDIALRTFNGHPHYEIMPTGQVFDGDDEVMGYYRTTRAAFPDQRHDSVRFHVAADAIVAVFFFDNDRITNERVYFDAASLLRQIGRSELLGLAGRSQE